MGIFKLKHKDQFKLRLTNFAQYLAIINKYSYILYRMYNTEHVASMQ